jgi:hypothetical protein
MIGVTESGHPARRLQVIMRTRPVLALLFVAALASPAAAQKVDGAYEVKFEEMSTNCDPPRFAYTRGVVRIDTAKSSLRVNIETIPQMAGVPGKSGKISAKTPKKVATTVQGLDGRYSVSGRVDDTGVLQLVLVAEFSKTGETKTMCTQSWNISGVRQAAEKAPDKPVKKSALDIFPLFD